MGHSSSSAKLKHTAHGRRRSLTVDDGLGQRQAALARAAFMRWNARRCALRGPMPGSRASSATSRSTDGVRTTASRYSPGMPSPESAGP